MKIKRSRQVATGLLSIAAGVIAGWLLYPLFGPVMTLMLAWIPAVVTAIVITLIYEREATHARRQQ